VRVQLAAAADRGAIDGDAGPAVMAADAAGLPGCGVGTPAPLADRPAAGVAGADPGLLPAPAASLRQVIRLGAGGTDAPPVWPVGTQEPVAPAVGAPRLGNVAATRAAQLADQAQYIDRHGGLAAGQGVRPAPQVPGDDTQPRGGVSAGSAAAGGQQAAAGLIARHAVQQAGDQPRAVGQRVPGVAADAALPGRPVVADVMAPGGTAPDRPARRSARPAGRRGPARSRPVPARRA